VHQRLGELIAVLTLLTLTLPLIRSLTPRLITARLFPSHDRANQLPAWRWHADLLTDLAIAAATATVGLLAHLVSFALALRFDQPYGPLLAALLLALFLCGEVASRWALTGLRRR